MLGQESVLDWRSLCMHEGSVGETDRQTDRQTQTQTDGDRETDTQTEGNRDLPSVCILGESVVDRKGEKV